MQSKDFIFVGEIRKIISIWKIIQSTTDDKASLSWTWTRDRMFRHIDVKPNTLLELQCTIMSRIHYLREHFTMHNGDARLLQHFLVFTSKPSWSEVLNPQLWGLAPVFSTNVMWHVFVSFILYVFLLMSWLSSKFSPVHIVCILPSISLPGWSSIFWEGHSYAGRYIDRTLGKWPLTVEKVRSPLI